MTRRRLGVHTALSVACTAMVALVPPSAGASAAGVTAAGVTAAGVTAAGVTAAGVTAAGVAAVARTAELRRPVRIMPLGDSITMGIGSETMSSYRSDLYRRLTGAGVAVDFVGSARNGVGGDTDHEGHSGWTIDKISRSVDAWLVTYRPDVVLLHIGTNDMRQDATAKGASARLSVLLDQIRFRLPEASILVARLTGAKRTAEQRRIDAYNRQMPGIVAGLGARVRLVDQSTVDGLDIRDNLHPNDHGFAKMSWNWFAALRPVLRPAGTAAWPAGVNPYRLTRARLCQLEATYPQGRYVPVIRCDWWHTTVVIRRVAGRETRITRWVRE